MTTASSLTSIRLDNETREVLNRLDHQANDALRYIHNDAERRLREASAAKKPSTITSPGASTAEAPSTAVPVQAFSGWERAIIDRANTESGNGDQWITLAELDTFLQKDGGDHLAPLRQKLIALGQPGTTV